MRKFVPGTLPSLWQHSCKPILSGLWIVGLLFGMVWAAGAGDSLSLTMRGVNDFPVSIPGLLLVTVLPFLITAAAVYFSLPWLLSMLVFGKAVSFGFCAWWITAAFGTASWLIRILMMFTDLCVLPLLMWLWLRHGDLSDKSMARDVTICLAITVAVGLLDISAVSPFAALLI